LLSKLTPYAGGTNSCFLNQPLRWWNIPTLEIQPYAGGTDAADQSSTTDLTKGLEICLNSSNFTFRGKTLQTSFWNSNGLPHIISSGTLIHEEHRNMSFRNLHLCGKDM